MDGGRRANALGDADGEHGRLIADIENVAGRDGPRRRRAQKQNGSWCRHQPPLVPGPNAAPVRAWPLSWDRVPAEVLRPRSVPNRNPEGLRSELPWGRPTTVSLSPHLRPKAPVSLDPRRKWDRPEGLTLLLRRPIHCFGGLRPEGHRPPPRWPRIETFFRRRKSVPHRET